MKLFLASKAKGETFSLEDVVILPFTSAEVKYYFLSVDVKGKIICQTNRLRIETADVRVAILGVG